jgi:hypothetical protein
MDPHILYPADPRDSPVVMTDAQLAELDRKWDELFTPEFRRRDMVLTKEGSAERKARLRTLRSLD